MTTTDLALLAEHVYDAEWAHDVAAGRIPLVGGATRPMFPHERRSGVNFATMDAATNAASWALLANLSAVRNALSVWLERSMPADDPHLWMMAVEARGVMGFPELAEEVFPPLVDTAYRILDDAAAAGWVSVMGEAAQGGPGPYSTLSDDSVMDAALDGTNLLPAMAWRTVTGAATACLKIATLAATVGKDPVIALNEAKLAAAADECARIPSVAAHRLGRLAALQAATGGPVRLEEGEPLRSVYASELLDRNTCERCERIDGAEFPSMEAAMIEYPHGLYRYCQGGPRCRGTLVLVHADEEQMEPWPDEEPPTPVEIDTVGTRMRTRRSVKVSDRRPSDVAPGSSRIGGDQAWTAPDENGWSKLRRRPHVRVRRVDERNFELQTLIHGHWRRHTFGIWARLQETTLVAGLLPPGYVWTLSAYLFNPNHDSLGRFASKGGGFTGGRPSYKISDIERHQPLTAQAGWTPERWEKHGAGERYIPKTNNEVGFTTPGGNEIRDRFGLNDDEVVTIASTVDTLTGIYGGGPRTVRTVDNHEAFRDAGDLSTGRVSAPTGWTTDGDSRTINVNVTQTREIDAAPRGWTSGSMPMSKKADGLSYTIAHEFGHTELYLAASKAHPGRSKVMADRASHLGGLHNDTIARSMSKYGQQNAHEAFAEAFAEWNLSGGLTRNKAARVYAVLFAWPGNAMVTPSMGLRKPGPAPHVQEAMLDGGDAAALANPYHKGPGPGGGQFTTAQGLNSYAKGGLAPNIPKGEVGTGLTMDSLPVEVQDKITETFTNEIATPKQAELNLLNIGDEAMLNPTKAAKDAAFYSDEHKWGVGAAAKENVPQQVFFASTAALSPGCNWVQNKKRAEDVARDMNPKRPYKLDKHVTERVNGRMQADRTTQVRRQAARDLGYERDTKKKPYSDEQVKLINERMSVIDNKFPPAFSVTEGTSVIDLALVNQRAAAVALAAHNRMGLRTYSTVEAAVSVYIDGPDKLVGSKTRSFTNNLMFPKSDRGDVTVDVWHWRAMALGHTDLSGDGPRLNILEARASRFTGTPKYKTAAIGTYPLAADITRRALTQFNAKYQTAYNVAEYQALIWGTLRDLNPIGTIRGLKNPND